MALWRGFGARSPIVLPAVSLKRVVTSPEEHDVFATRLQAVDGRGGYGERVLLLFKACPSLRRLSDRLLDFFVTRAAGTKSAHAQVNHHRQMTAASSENAQLRRRDARNRNGSSRKPLLFDGSVKKTGVTQTQEPEQERHRRKQPPTPRGIGTEDTVSRFFLTEASKRQA